MSKDFIVSMLHDKYAALAPSDRKRLIRELIAESPSSDAFIRQNFPDFYAEALPAHSQPSRKRGTKKVATKARSKQIAKRR